MPHDSASSGTSPAERLRAHEERVARLEEAARSAGPPEADQEAFPLDDLIEEITRKLDEVSEELGGDRPARRMRVNELASQCSRALDRIESEISEDATPELVDFLMERLRSLRHQVYREVRDLHEDDPTGAPSPPDRISAALASLAELKREGYLPPSSN